MSKGTPANPWSPSERSQAGRILRVLEDAAQFADADWAWVSTHNLIYFYRIPAVIHSRISELRDHGWNIEHRTIGEGAKGSQYRLVLPEEGRAAEPSPLLRRPSSESTTQLKTGGA